MTILKKCSKCKESKDISQFGKSRNTFDGLYSYCKRCRLVNPKRSDKRQVNTANGLYYCSDCKEWFSVTEFYPNPANKNGIHGQCKDCTSKRSRNNYLTNRDSKRDKVNEANRKRRQANLEEYQERDRRYEASHREDRARCQRKRYLENPEKSKVSERRRRVAMFNAPGNHTEEEWQALCSYYMDQCLACGEVPEKLSRDHVIPISRGGSDDISNIQPLCLSCNKSKRINTTDYRQ